MLGCFRYIGNDRGRPRSERTPEVEEAVLLEVERNPAVSTREIANHLETSRSTVWRVLSEQLLHPYHVQRVQALSPATDYGPRVNFCRWFLRKCADDVNFGSMILFTDEAGFRRDGIVNFRNGHVWADENPHAIVQSRHQQQFNLNVWIGITCDTLIGPFFLPQRLNGETYLEFLQNDLPALLEDMPLAARHHLWYMQDGAPPHFARIVRNHLNTTFGERWIGRGGPQPWPARSPDLNPLDFYLWGHLKSVVYATPVPDVAELRERIINGCIQIRGMPGIFERVRQSMLRRVRSCIEMEGGHFEHLL